MFMNLSYEGFSLTYVLVMIAISRDLEDQTNLYFDFRVSDPHLSIHFFAKIAKSVTFKVTKSLQKLNNMLVLYRGDPLFIKRCLSRLPPFLIVL